MPTGFTELRHRLEPLVGKGAEYTPLSGGDTCEAYRACGRRGRFFLKLGHAVGDMFAREADNLAAMAATCTVRVPQVIAAEDSFLLLELIDASSPGNDYWPILAQQLAGLHRIEQAEFGFERDNYCGRNVQKNTRTGDGHEFFARYRLAYQAEQASRNGLLQNHHRRQLDRLCERLPELIPTQAPALLHGDLWSGNHFAASDGRPVLVDPACYWGWPEADLAMMTLFGSPPERFFEVYREHAELASGWQQRFAIYNLYHLLNHLNLFGASYLSAVEQILRRYGE